MSWRIEFARDAERDFALIFAHLVDSYQAFGESAEQAHSRAGERVLGLVVEAERIATAPHRGSLQAELLPGLRRLALGKATFWYLADEDRHLIRVLAVFFGGQDQHRRMLLRLLQRHDS